MGHGARGTAQNSTFSVDKRLILATGNQNFQLGIFFLFHKRSFANEGDIIFLQF